MSYLFLKVLNVTFNIKCSNNLWSTSFFVAILHKFKTLFCLSLRKNVGGNSQHTSRSIRRCNYHGTFFAIFYHRMCMTLLLQNANYIILSVYTILITTCLSYNGIMYEWFNDIILNSVLQFSWHPDHVYNMSKLHASRDYFFC